LSAVTADPAPAVSAPPAREIDRWLPGRGACAALCAGSILAFLLSPLGHHWPFVDLGVYRYGGRAVLDGANLYALRFPGALAFTYPPLSALAFAPLALVENAANQALRGALARVLHSTSVEAWWLLTAALVGAVGMTLALQLVYADAYVLIGLGALALAATVAGAARESAPAGRTPPPGSSARRSPSRGRRS